MVDRCYRENLDSQPGRPRTRRLEQRGHGTGSGLPSQRSLSSVTGQLQWPWANVAIERLLAHLGYCHPHHIAFATVGTGSSSNNLHSSKAPTAKSTGRLTLSIGAFLRRLRACLGDGGGVVSGRMGASLRLRRLLPGRTRSAPCFMSPGGVRGAGAGLRLLLPGWTRSAPCFVSPGGVRGAGAGLLLLLPGWTRSAPCFVSPGGVR